MSKTAAAGTVFTSMLILGVAIILQRGWLSDFSAFVHSKVSGGPTTAGTPAQNAPAMGPTSGLNDGSSGNPNAGGNGGGGSW